MQIGKKDILWSYVAQGLRWGSFLIVLPLALNRIPAKQMAFWYLFTTVNSLVMLFDFGFSPTIARNVTYIFSGAKSLLKRGIERSPETAHGEARTEEVDGELLSRLISSAKYLYRSLAIVFAVLILSAGTWYVHSIMVKNAVEGRAEIWTAWGIMTVSIVVSFYYLYLNALLLGRGYVLKLQKATVVSNIVSLLVAFSGLMMGYGIVAMAVASLATLIVNRYLCVRYFFDKPYKKLIAKVDRDAAREGRKKLLGTLWFNAKRSGTVTLGGFLVSRFGQFFVTSFFALAVAAKYGLTMQVILVVSGLAATYTNVMMPKITYEHFNKNISEVRRHFGLMATVVFVTYAVACAGLLLAGEPLLELIRSKTQLLPSLQIAFLFLIYFLESQHSAFANIHSIDNRIPFVKPAIISGGVMLVATFLVMKFISANLWYLMLIQFVVQASYNNWKWVYDACRKLKTGYFGFYRTGFSELYRIVKRTLIARL